MFISRKLKRSDLFLCDICLYTAIFLLIALSFFLSKVATETRFHYNINHFIYVFHEINEYICQITFFK